jgi:hypothetical protein
MLTPPVLSTPRQHYRGKYNITLVIIRKADKIYSQKKCLGENGSKNSGPSIITDHSNTH